MPESDQTSSPSGQREIPDRGISDEDRIDQPDLVFKREDADSYDAVVDLFDHFSQRFTSRIPACMYDMAGLPGCATVLDIGTGSGIVASHVARRAGSGTRVVGVDLSFGMLSFAGQRALKRIEADRPDFLMMDAEQLAFRDSAFDVVFSLYALPHFPRPDQALAEMYRVLKPGGTLVVGVGSGPPLLSLAGLKAALRRIASVARSATGRELRACEFLDTLVGEYVPESEAQRQASSGRHGHLPGSALPELVRAAGFSRIRTDWAGQYSIIDSVDEFYQLQMTFSSVARKRLRNADDAVVRQLRARFDERCQSVKRRKGRLVYQSGALLVAGTKPKG